MINKNIPVPTVRRLANYLPVLLQKKEEGKRFIASRELADELFIESGKVRKDFQYARIKGRPKRGYEINYLIREIDSKLNWTGYKRAVLIGVGNLGSALLSYENFSRYGIQFTDAFDIDRRRVGMNIHDIKVSHMDNIEKVLKDKKIDIAVLTVPATVALETAEKVTSLGIKGIWNFSPVMIKSTPETAVVSAQLAESLAVLTQQL